MSDHRPARPRGLQDATRDGTFMWTDGVSSDTGSGHEEGDPHKTRPTLFPKLQRGDQQAWQDFADLYGPTISKCCRDASWRYRSLQLREDDLVAELLFKLYRKIQKYKYDPERGRFRAWLKIVIKRTLIDQARGHMRAEKRKGRVPRGTGDSANRDRMNQVPAPAITDEAVDEMADEVTKRKLYEEACRLVKARVADRTWRAFEETAHRHRDPVEVARELGLSRHAVDQHKCSVLKKLREEVHRLKGSRTV